MGHERLGFLPRTRRWQSVVAFVADFSSDAEVANLASQTIRNVRRRYERAALDEGVQAAFQFLLALCLAARHEPRSSPALPDLALADNPSPLRLAVQLSEWVDRHHSSLEYGTLAKSAAQDTISAWTQIQTQQGSLFASPISSAEVWRGASNPAAFSEIVRLFFAHFTERYLKYFLDREASSLVASPLERERLAVRLEDHASLVAHHSLETALITQSFGAGWFAKRVATADSQSIDVLPFLRLAFSKLSEELVREGQTRE